MQLQVCGGVVGAGVAVDPGGEVGFCPKVGFDVGTEVGFDPGHDEQLTPPQLFTLPEPPEQPPSPPVLEHVTGWQPGVGVCAAQQAGSEASPLEHLVTEHES